VARARPGTPTEWSHKSPVDTTMLLIIAALTVAGIVAVFSASYPSTSRPLEDGTPGNAYRLLVTQSLHAALGALLCLLCSYIHPRRFHDWALRGLIAAVFLMLLVFTPLGVEMGGTRGWLRLGPVMFQPCEFAKIALIVFLARCISAAKEWPTRQVYTYAAAMGTTGLMCGICLVQNDLGSAAVMFCFGLTAIFFAGLRWWAVALTWGLASVLGLGLAWVEPYRWRRITAFLHPTHDTDDTAYQIIRMLIACARGGLIGPGLGLSREKWLGLPARHTDAIFCVIASELGFIGAATLVLVFLVFMYRGVALARLQPDGFSSILVASLASCIALQAFINMGVATGVLPCTGITLPFISAGGSSLLMTLAASGIILSLSRQARARSKEAQSECQQAA